MNPLVDAGSLGLALGALAVLVSVALAGSLVAHREYATARSLLGVALAMVLGSLLHVVASPATPVGVSATPGVAGADRWWIVTGAAATVVAGGLWMLFAVKYAGRGRRLFRGAIAGVAVLAAAAVGIAGVAAWTGPDPTVLGGLTVVFLLTGFLVTVGVYAMLWASVGQNAFPVEEPLLLSVGVVVLLSGVHVAQVFQRPALYPAAVAVAGLVFLGTVRRFPVFETVPVARVAGRDRILDEMDDGVLVVDREGHIRDLNPAAARLFGVDRGAVLDEPLSSLAGVPIEPAEAVAATEPRRLETAHGRSLTLTGNRVSDRRGRRVGTLLLCTDVTEQQIRTDRLTLLGQCVGDAVRDAAAEVAADVAPVTGAGDPARERTVVADRAWTTATAMTRLVANAREIEDAIGETTRTPAACPDLRQVVRTAVDASDGQEDSAPVDQKDDPTIATDLPPDPVPVAVPAALLRVVLTQVLDDAARRADARVDLAVLDDDGPTIRVRDDGPAIQVRDDGCGRADVPASGEAEGLALVPAQVAVEQVGGDLGHTGPADGGRSTTVRLPATDRTEPEDETVTRSRGRVR